MLKLIIEDDEGRKTVVPFVREEITIGRQEGNTIRLTERNVSRRHARLLRQDGHVVVEDLGSSNGTRINGDRISGQSAVKDGDLIQIGDYDLAVQSDAATSPSTARMRSVPAQDEPSDPDGSASEPETETETPVQDEGAPSAASADQRRHSTAIIRMDHVESTRARKVEELDPEEAPRLVVVSSELKGQEFACIRTELRIGRTDDNDIVIDHRSLSRTHAKIVREAGGEWRILDMQSANGLTVNGESYAQASLSNGDIIEMGHVRLRFVGAGEAAAKLDGHGRSKLPLVLALGGALLVGVAALFFLGVGPFKPDPGTPPKQPEITQGPADPKPADPQENPPPRPPEPPPETAKPPPEEQPDPAAVAAAAQELQGRIESARRALAEGSFDKAEVDLKPVKTKEGWPAEVQPLIEQIATERQNDQALSEAQRALAEKKYDQAEQLLELAGSTSVKPLAQKRDKLVADLAQARKLEQPKAPPTPPKQRPPLGPSVEDEARTAYQDAYKLYGAKQYKEAVVMGRKCVELTPKDANCHKLLGVLYVSLNQMDLAAQHYREFLKLAPEHPLAPKIKESLDAYERQNPK